MSKLKIAFAGTPNFAFASLENLATDSAISIEKVFSQPDRPVGRGQKIAPPPIKILAEKLNLPIEQNRLTAQNLPRSIDFLAVVAFGQILPKEVLTVPKFGCVNLHASLLPKFRGATPIQSAILDNAKKTGISFQKVSEKLDTGDLFASFEIKFKNENFAELSAKLAKLGGVKFPEILHKIANSEISATPQNENEATFCKKIKKIDGRINWLNDSTEILIRKKRAFFEWPGTWTTFKNQNLKLIEFIEAKKFGKKTGEIFEFEKRVFVGTIDSSIELKKIQLASKKVLPAVDFARGNPNFIGAFLK